MPRLYIDQNRLFAVTTASEAVMTLGAASKRIILDPATRTMTIDARTFWFIRSHRLIAFDSVTAILVDEKLYQAREYDTNNNWSANGQMETDFDSITVRLALKEGEIVKLFKFSGVLGAQYNDLLGIGEVPSLTFQDSQIPAADYYARALSTLMQAPVSKEMNF